LAFARAGNAACVGSDEQFDANRSAREHVERTRRRLREGRAELERLHESIDDTRKHIASMSDWIDGNERALDAERTRRAS
jgi:predicted  nucleic acid-binding Zn-ribbon protein